VRKIAASEKLMANLERGSGSDILGAIVTENRSNDPKPRVIADDGTVMTANASAAPPSEMDAIFV
jgi:hypothetical protein